MISLYFTWEFAKNFQKTLPTQTQSFRASSTAAVEVKTFNAVGLGTRCLNFLRCGPHILFRKRKKRNGSLGIVEILQIQKVSPATERT